MGFAFFILNFLSMSLIYLV
uniref:Uncharacterized protein n=1 Tax=Arundo donax TaxID=35708 RepID=A0A0A8YB05_ARUDO